MIYSTLYGYKVSRNLKQLKGDVGSTVSASAGAHILLGQVPEVYYTYTTEEFDKEPTAFQYFLAQNYKAELAKNPKFWSIVNAKTVE